MEQTERVILEVDERGAAKAVSSTNKQIAALEVQFARAGQTAEQRLLAKIATLQQRMSGDPLKLKELETLQQRVLAKMNANLDGHGSKWKELGTKIREGIENPLRAAGGAVESLLTKLGPVGAVVAGVVVAITGVAKAGFEAMKSLGEFGDSVEDASVRLGLTIEQVAKYRFAMKYAGGDLGMLESMMRKLSQEIEGGGKNLSEMGVEWRDVTTGALLPMNDVLLNLAQRLSELPAGPIRNAEAIKVMGRAALEVLPKLMELPEGLERAEELQKKYTPEQIERWRKYKHKIAEIESAWESLKRSMKEPLAAIIYRVVKGPDAGESQSDYAMRTMFGRPDVRDRDAIEAERGLRDARGKRQGADAATMRAAAVKADINVIRNNSLIDAALGGDGEARLSAAKDKLKGLRDELEKMRDLYPEATAEQRAKVAAQQKVVDGIEAEVEATKKLGQEQKAALKSLEQWEKQVSQMDMGPVAKAFAKVAELPAKLQNRGNVVALQEARRELEKMEEEYAKVATAMEKASIERWAKAGEAAVKEMELSTSNFAKNWLANLNEIRDRAREVDQRQISEGRAASTHAGRMAELSAGPGQEVAAIEREYAVRVESIKAEAAIVEEHAQLYDIDQKRWELQQEMREAGYDYEERVAELQRKRMDELRSSMEGLLDAAFTKSKGILDALKNMAQAVFLTPVKQGVSALMAQALMPAMYGKDGKGGIMGAISGVFNGGGGLNNVRLVNGAVPVVIQGAAVGASAGVGSMMGGFLGSSGGGEVLGAGRNTVGLTQLASGLWARGGAGGIENNPLINYDTWGRPSGGGGGIGGWAQQASGYSGWKGMLSRLGDIGRGAPNQGPMPDGSVVPSGQHGVGGAAGGGMLLGGSALFMDGMRRGGGWGVAESAGGGALIGAKFGGPIGAVIGGIAGAVAGLIRLGIKSKAEKVIDKVKTLYGITIDKKIAQQIVQIGKERYADNIDMAVRSQEAKELLQLYAQTTGQKSAALMAGRVHSASLIQSRGELMQGPTMDNGQAYFYASSLKRYGGGQGEQIGTSSPNAGPTYISLHVNGESAAAFMDGRIAPSIAGNPRLVASSALNGSRQTSARGGWATSSLAPGVIQQ